MKRKIVPVEPTTAMKNAAVDVDSYKLGDISPLGFRISPQMLFGRTYAAMLDAAPSHTEEDVERIRRAIHDPGMIVGPRRSDETLQKWQARAAIAQRANEAGGTP